MSQQDFHFKNESNFKRHKSDFVFTASGCVCGTFALLNGEDDLVPRLDGQRFGLREVGGI